MAIISHERFIRTMRKSAQIYRHTLANVTQEQAANAWDGDWNVIAVLCHLRDFEQVFFGRAQQMVNEEEPALVPVDHEALATEKDYNHQQLSEVLTAFLDSRQQFLEWMEVREPSDWQRKGVHPEHGPYSVLEQAIQTSTHDIDHLEQIVRMLAKA